MIKPDGVQRGLIGEIIKRFEQKGYKLIAMKLTSPGKAHMETHYEDLAGKKFFPGLIEYMTSGPVCEYLSLYLVISLILLRCCIGIEYFLVTFHSIGDYIVMR
jgi:hypothetical protein